MTYRKRVSFKPGPGFNVILGPNGSGKSSIEIALVIGLGGDLKTLKRQSNLGELVNRDAGDEKAEILIKIADDKMVSLANLKVSVMLCIATFFFGWTSIVIYFIELISYLSLTTRKLLILEKETLVNFSSLCENLLTLWHSYLFLMKKLV